MPKINGIIVGPTCAFINATKAMSYKTEYLEKCSGPQFTISFYKVTRPSIYRKFKSAIESDH